MVSYTSARTLQRKDQLPADFKPDLTVNHRVIRGEDVMTAVDDISRFVRSRLARAGCPNEMEDVLQDIRVAVWSGVSRGQYQPLPGIRFGAWVQGIAKNVCTAHIAKASARYTVPLFTEESDNHPAFDRPQEAVAEPAGVADREWAINVLKLARMCAGEEAWGSAMFLLLNDYDDSNGIATTRIDRADSPAYRRARRDLKFVRQVAITVRNALAVVDSDEAKAVVLGVSASSCLPTELHRAIAATIVAPRLSGAERLAALPVIAAKTNVTPRYVAVQIGRARALYLVALRVIRMSQPA
ncbi:sigma factor [Arthrobacter sp. GMC3]|uniref:sigma factor n=1 Tax=Arthrobacter sp. GMC3 TaxID=2058894 RepID=UPI000CE31E67|nr:sigma factor [Arthrobacter sp. GMC3]